MSQSYETRMEMIRKASKKFNAKIKRNQNVRKTETNYIEQVQKFNYDTGDNIYAWTDAPKYVDEYYGDRARAQSDYENEWN